MSKKIMPVHPNFNPDYLYFVTTTAERHVQILKHESIIQIILDSWHFLRTNGRMELFVFVIMPNHIHFIGRCSKKHTLSDVMRDFKRHTAQQIIRQLKAKEDSHMLALLRELNQDSRQESKIWEAGYDARDIFSVPFLEQKTEYIHYNPCRPQWNLASTPEDYPWSSARFYILDKPAVIPLDDVRDLFV